MNLYESTFISDNKTLKDLVDQYMFSQGIDEQLHLLVLFHNIDHNVSEIAEKLETHVATMESNSTIYAVTNKSKKIAVLHQIIAYKKGRNDFAAKHAAGMKAYAEMHAD